MGALVKRFGGSKVLIHFGGGSVVRSGLPDRIKASLDAEGIGHVELGGVQPNPRSGLVYKGIELARAEQVDFILAVGGCEADIPAMAHTACYGNGRKGTLGSFVVLSEEDVANILRLTL